MNSRPSYLVAIGLAATLACVGANVVSSPVGAGATDEKISSPKQFKFLGAGSCAAAGCHGSPGAAGATGSEYPTWAAHDKHARAYEALFRPCSLKIMELLGRKNAHEDRQCLSCHVLPEFDMIAAQAPEFFKGDGVSCESCHGAGHKWVPEHYKTSWKTFSSHEKQALGMRDTKSLPGRAQLCLDCHVGSPTADVNHDLIAAGHPRLNFEFAAYHAGWPRHWPDRLDKEPAFGGQPDFEARAWIIGQLKTSQAALQLLRTRAADQRKPWPEFAELDCYACHHDLQSSSWRQRPETNKHKAGNMPWSSWYSSQVPTAISVGQNPIAAALLKTSLDDIGHAIAAKANRRQIAAAASDAQANLDRAISRQKSDDSVDVQKLYQAITVGIDKRQPRNWDEAAQTFLALAAVHNAWTDEKAFVPAARLRPYIVRLRDKLRFSDGFNSQRRFDPGLPERNAVKEPRTK